MCFVIFVFALFLLEMVPLMINNNNKTFASFILVNTKLLI